MRMPYGPFCVLASGSTYWPVCRLRFRRPRSGCLHPGSAWPTGRRSLSKGPRGAVGARHGRPQVQLRHLRRCPSVARPGLVTNSIIFYWLFTISMKSVICTKTQLFLTLSWDLSPWLTHHIIQIALSTSSKMEPKQRLLFGVVGVVLLALALTLTLDVSRFFRLLALETTF